MKFEMFNKIVEEILTACNNTLTIKEKEYSMNSDRLHNFKRAGSLLGEPPEVALVGMWVKHIVSIVDTVEKIKNKEELPHKDMIKEKIVDSINYSILLYALIEERRIALEGE